jgi:hypothetical protein
MPLHKASYHGISGIVGLLLKFGVDVDAHDNDTMTPLFLVFQCHWGNNSRITKTAQVLLDHGANVHKQDKNGQMPLHKASQHCLSRIVEFLLKLGADVGTQDNNNITPLYFAVSSSFQCGLYKLHLNDSPVLWSIIILNLDMYPEQQSKRYRCCGSSKNLERGIDIQMQKVYVQYYMSLNVITIMATTNNPTLLPRWPINLLTTFHTLLVIPLPSQYLL